MENLTAQITPPGTTSTAALTTTTGILGLLLSTFGLTSDLTSLTSFFLIFSFIYQNIGYRFHSLWTTLTSLCYSSLTIRQDDWEVYMQFLDWMQDQPFAKTSRNLHVGMQPVRFLCYEDDGETDPQEREYCFTPRPGWHLLWFNKRPVLFIRRVDAQRDMYGVTNENFELYSLGRDPKVLKALLEDVRQQHLQKDAEKTIVYRDGGVLGKGDGWKRCYSRHSRPLSTVVLDEEQRDAFIRDIKDYLLPSTARWYAQRGIPYRRGYIFYGPPGTGKSSLSFAIAGLFKLKIYVINLASASLSEDHLCSLFSSLPRQCIVLLEDIDAAFIDRSTPAAAAAIAPKPSRLANLPGLPKKPNKPDEAPAKTGVSFSGLLNALDGVASQEGRILIMTTNHIEKLDPALIRPGRVDMRIEFQLASKPVLVSLFERMFEVFPEESPNSDIPLDPKAAEKVLKGLSQEFAELVPGECFSPAEIQGFLLKYKRRPRDAVCEVAGWVAEEVKKREEKKREAEKDKSVETEGDGKSEKRRRGLGWTRSLRSRGSRSSGSVKGGEKGTGKS